MAYYLNDDVLDYGLSRLSSTITKRLDICTAQPATFAEATTTYTKGYKTPVSIGNPENSTVNGRKVVVAAISTGLVTGTASVNFFGITATTQSKLLVAGEMASSQAVTSGNTFTLGAFNIRIPDAE